MDSIKSISIWTEKYKPKKVVELTTNNTAIKSIYSWLVNYDKMKNEVLKNINNKKLKNQAKTTNHELKSCMLITGGHGVGKSITIEVILKDLGYNAVNLDINILKAGKNVDDVIKKIMLSSNILSIMNNDAKKKLAIVIDEIEAITASAEKTCITSLQKMNEQNWYCPIIFISNNQHNKLLSDIKKSSYEIKMWPPFPSDMKKILLRVAGSENIKIKSETVINKIIDHVQGDIRRLIFTLQDIKNAYGNKIITIDTIDEYKTMSNRKDIDIDLYKATDELLYEYTSIDNCLRLYETEKVLLPLMVHQNYAKSIIGNYKSDESRHNLIRQISDSLSIGDVIENYIYGDQNWEMQEIHGFYTCVAPSYYLCNGIKNEPNKVKLAFATDLNKTSIKRINKKNIINTDKCFRNMNINDYIYINKIIRKLISENKIQECSELLKPYNIKLEHIESLLKIDKIRDTKTTLTSRQKNEFISDLDN
jgi:DNA polymerase III delta prime subunit